MAMVMSIVNLSLTLPMPYNRHDLSLPTNGLQHEVFFDNDYSENSWRELVSSQAPSSSCTYEIPLFWMAASAASIVCITDVCIGTPLRNDMWGKISPFLTLNWFWSVSVVTRVCLPTCRRWPVAARCGLIQACGQLPVCCPDSLVMVWPGLRSKTRGRIQTEALKISIAQPRVHKFRASQMVVVSTFCVWVPPHLAGWHRYDN